MAFTIPNELSAAYPAQAGLYSSDVDILTTALAAGGVLSGCAVTPSSGMTVAIASGRVRLSNSFSFTGKTVGATTKTLGTADVTNARFDLVVVDTTGAVQVRAGTAAASPVAPSLTSGDIALAQVYVPANAASISAGMIIDKRVLIGSAPGVLLATDYGAVPDDFYMDGVSNATTTFTSATANFTAADVGKTFVALRAGPSSLQDHHTTIASVTNSTTVVLANATGRSQTSVRFYISRAGDQTAAIQSALDAAEAQGGGTVLLNGVGFLTTGITLPNRVTICGLGKRATMLHLQASSNIPVIQNDQTSQDSAAFCAVRDLWVDGNRFRQSDTTTTLAAAYTAGNTTISLTDASSFTNSGSILIGTNRLLYESKTGNTLNNVVGGVEGTTDASAASGATVTQHKCHGIHFVTNPYNVVGTIAESYDPHHEISNVYIKNVKGDGVSLWGQSETRVINTVAHYADHFGFRPSFDSWIIVCTSNTTGRAGFFFRSSEVKCIGSKAFYCGGNVAAEGYGFFLEGPSSTEEGTKVLSGCGAQDNKADGFYLRLAQRVNMQVTSSSNGTGTIGAYAGVKIDGCTNGIIDAVCTERVASPNNAQQNALIILSTTVTTTGMQIRVSHGASVGSAVGTAIKAGGSWQGCDIRVNGMGGNTTSAPAAAGTVTPDPYVATNWDIQLPAGNITVANPANGHVGCTLRITIIKDASVTARTVTWGSQYKFTAGAAPTLTTTASNRDSVEFKFNGTNWYETDRTLNVAA